MKNAHNGLASRLTWPKKESVSPKICQQKHHKLNCKEKKKNAKKENIQEEWGSYKRCNILIMEIPEGQERRSVM